MPAKGLSPISYSPPSLSSFLSISKTWHFFVIKLHCSHFTPPPPLHSLSTWHIIYSIHQKYICWKYSTLQYSNLLHSSMRAPYPLRLLMSFCQANNLTHSALPHFQTIHFPVHLSCHSSSFQPPLWLPVTDLGDGEKAPKGDASSAVWLTVGGQCGLWVRLSLSDIA